LQFAVVRAPVAIRAARVGAISTIGAIGGNV